VRLGLFGGVVLGVLRKVAVGTRIGDLLDDAGPLDLLAMLQLGLERGIARVGHGDLFHRSLFVLRRTQKNSRPGQAALARPAIADIMLSGCRPVPKPCRA
jgi:hypothetical protein